MMFWAHMGPGAGDIKFLFPCYGGCQPLVQFVKCTSPGPTHIKVSLGYFEKEHMYTSMQLRPYMHAASRIQVQTIFGSRIQVQSRDVQELEEALHYKRKGMVWPPFTGHGLPP